MLFVGYFRLLENSICSGCSRKNMKLHSASQLFCTLLNKKINYQNSSSGQFYQCNFRQNTYAAGIADKAIAAVYI